MFTSKRARLRALLVGGALLGTVVVTPLHASASTPGTITVTNTSSPFSWTSDAFPGGLNVTNSQGDNCFDATGHPNPRTPSGPAACEVFTLQVTVPAGFWTTNSGRSGTPPAAADAIGYSCTGLELDPHYFRLAEKAIPRLAALYPHFKGEQIEVELNGTVEQNDPDAQLAFVLAETPSRYKANRPNGR